MLPGFRLLAITVVLAASLLVFGLGAAALLRATHEEFAAAPLRNLQTPTSNFVGETPTLAVLQVEPPIAEPAIAERRRSRRQFQNTQSLLRSPLPPRLLLRRWKQPGRTMKRAFRSSSFPTRRRFP